MARFVREQAIEHRIGADGRFLLRATDPSLTLRAAQDDVARVRIQFELNAEDDAGADALLDRVRFASTASTRGLEVTEPRLREGGVGSIVRLIGIGGPRVATTIVAEVPAGADVTLDVVSGDLDADGMRGHQEYRSISGDLRLIGIGGDVRIRGVSSDVSLRTDGSLRLEANTVSGDVTAMAASFDSVRITTVSGDIELEGALPMRAETRLESVSGDVALGLVGGVTLDVRGLASTVDVSLPHRAEGSRDRRRYIVGDGAARVVFRTMSGDLVAHAARRVEPVAAPAAARPAPADELDILRALERGEIDVEEAERRLAGGGTDA